MNPIEAQIHDLKEEGTDILAAALVAALMSLETLAEDVLFQPLGDFRRNHSMDIARAHAPFSTTMQQDKTVLQLHRSSLYDGLPEGLFHQSEENKPFRSTSEMKALVKENDEKEANARKFFLPFDHELMVVRAGIAKNESNQIQNVISAVQLRGLKKFWSLPKYLSSRAQGKMLLLLPLAHRIRNDLRLLEQAMELIIEHPVSVRKSFDPISTPFPNPVSLDGMVLGVNSLLGDEHKEVQAVLRTTIGPVSKEVASDFAPGGSSLRKLELILDMFVPCNMVCEFDVTVDEQDRWTPLDVDEARLGLTTFLSVA